MKVSLSSRRMFLEGAGSLLAIPFLESLLPKTAHAQNTPVKRFISIITGYDFGHHAAWLPGATNVTNIAQPTQTFTPTTGEQAMRYQRLRDFVPSSTSVLSPVAGADFNPYLDSMTVMRGLNHAKRYGHGSAQILGGIIGPAIFNPDRSVPTIETADVVLNKNRAFNPAGLPLALLGNGGYGEGIDSYSYVQSGGAAGNVASFGDEALAIYNRLFSNGSYPEGGQVSSPRSDLLSRVMEDYTRVRNSRNISAADRATLDNALAQFSDTQASLRRVVPAECRHRGLARTGLVSMMASNAAAGAAVANIIASAIICDAARVFTVGAPLLGGTIDGQADGHDPISHLPFQTYGSRTGWQILASRQAATVRNFVAPLLQRLSAATDPSNGRSYLYNSIVYYTAESGIAHGWGSQPVMLFGNAAGSLRSGSYIDYSNRSRGAFHGGDNYSPMPGTPTFSNNWAGVAYNRLLVTILQAMGLTPRDYENPARNAQFTNRTDLGAHNANIPSIGGFGYAVPQSMTGVATSGWAYDDYLRQGIEGQDLRQFGNPLPFPPA